MVIRADELYAVCCALLQKDSPCNGLHKRNGLHVHFVSVLSYYEIKYENYRRHHSGVRYRLHLGFELSMMHRHLRLGIRHSSNLH